MDWIVYSVGSINIYWYGLVCAAAVLAFMLVTWIWLRLRRDSFAPVIDMLLWGLPLGLVLGRAIYVIRYWDLYRDDLNLVFALWQGGLSVYGAFAGFLLAVILCCYRENIPFWRCLDGLAPGIIAALLISQLGNFVAPFTVGMPLPSGAINEQRLAEYVEYAYRPAGFEGYEYFKPVALYQAGLQLFVLFAAVWAAWPRRQQRLPSGMIFLASMLLLTGIRFACGYMYLTTDASGALHFGQRVCLAGGAVCLLFLWFRWRTRQKLYF